MKYLFFLATILLWSCKPNTTPSAEKSANTVNTTPAVKTDKQINLTILLDLSDRIDPLKNPAKPGHFERDSALISYLSEYFVSHMKTKGTYMAKGKMRVVFHPNPPDPAISQAATKLSVDLSKMDVKQKKVVYETLNQTVAENVSNIYNTTMRQAAWPGSDIWRFFKNDVKEIAVEPDSSYRNLLVIFTDGYIYHADSKDSDKNRYAYILPELFDKYKLRNDNNWSKKIDDLDLGLISKRSDLDQLEVLVLEVTPSEKYKNDEDIIRKIMDKWFGEMKVRKWKIINSDLFEFTKQKIESFLRE
ncbi:hypothetical protein L3C95_27950 [Chitinophaga filiformis]|uniref:hypothetical protein n=1 Tax=Chitinophaga filiformis TaxID=104663 RepID=UPI001F1E5679|nr:hypothetical protein [Chitinophaga filiformis]MCF6406763.1 hypothetical protein [Chitinophaga filiformis]